MNPQNTQPANKSNAGTSSSSNKDSRPKTGPKSADSGPTPKQQIVERIKDANSVLVTVGKNPSVDQLASAIGLTLMLSKLDKHATAVASGTVPQAIKFLEPNKVLHKGVDNLRDFIISLDKDKADKLRYKVEDNIVKIFITPFAEGLSQNDLQFTQGDYNVEVVVALGVDTKEDIDEAIGSHGRILHDATIITVNSGEKSGRLGSINWNEPAASSISEMLVSISEAFQGGLLDQQIANAFLTGIVAATDRFSSEATSPKVMTISAQLMAGGADQHLIVENLEKDNHISPQGNKTEVSADLSKPVAANSMSIAHEKNANNVTVPAKQNAQEKAQDPNPSNKPQRQKPTEQKNNNAFKNPTQAAPKNISKPAPQQINMPSNPAPVQASKSGVPSINVDPVTGSITNSTTTPKPAEQQNGSNIMNSPQALNNANFNATAATAVNNMNKANVAKPTMGTNNVVTPPQSPIAPSPAQTSIPAQTRIPQPPPAQRPTPMPSPAPAQPQPAAKPPKAFTGPTDMLDPDKVRMEINAALQSADFNPSHNAVQAINAAPITPAPPVNPPVPPAAQQVAPSPNPNMPPPPFPQ